MRTKIGCFLLILSSLFACSSSPLNENDPQSLYDHAIDNIDSSRYQLALDQLGMIKHKFPYSQLAIEAQWQMAEVYFRQDQFLESATSFEIFFDLYPKHPKAAYALFKIGDCYNKSTPSNIERDLTNADKAIRAYQNFIMHFGKHPDYVKESQESRDKIALLEEKLAQKELSIGNFYYRRDFYAAAQRRYERVLSMYSTTTTAALAKEKLRILSETGHLNESDTVNSDQK